MKLSTKIILPIILISALLILLTGCFGVPTDESPGYTPGTITGIIAAPCCSTSAEPVSEPCCVSPEYWCYYCQETWSLQDGVEVILTYGEDEIATVFTNKDGEFTFTNVSLGKNYVVTAYCQDFDDNRPLVKDVALELIEGGSFDTKITDLVSTSLGLVVDFLVLYTEWGPEDIVLDDVIAAKPNFIGFPKFKKLVYEVRRVVENCELNLLTDDDVQEALCLAAEEISKLDIGCAPGFTPPPPPPPPGPCAGNIAPVIDQVEGVDRVLLNGEPVSSGSTLNLVVGTLYEFCVYATDPDNKLPQDLTYSLTITKDGTTLPDIPMGTDNCYSGTPLADDVGTYEIYVNVSDGCDPISWGPVYVDVCQPIDKVVLIKGVDDTICVGEKVALSTLISKVETYAGTDLIETITGPCDPRLAFTFTPNPDGAATLDASCDVTGVTAGYVDITVTYTPAEGECGGDSVPGEAAVKITVEPIIDRVVIVEGFNDTICVDETVDLGDLISSVKTYAGTDLIETITDLCDPRLAFSFTDTFGEVSFDNTLCPTDQPTVTGVTAGDVDITVEYTPGAGECGTEPVSGDAAIQINVDQCLDCFILRIKLGGVTNIYTQDYFEPVTGVLVPDKVYIVDEELSSASKFQFMFNCPPGTLEYNYYRGKSCGGKWESGQDPAIQPDASAPPPEWLADSELMNGVFYPAKLAQGLLLCQHGGNILKIRVNGLGGPVFTFAIGRNSQP